MPVWSKVTIPYDGRVERMRLVPLYNEEDVSERMIHQCKAMRAADMLGEMQRRFPGFLLYSEEKKASLMRCCQVAGYIEQKFLRICRARADQIMFFCALQEHENEASIAIQSKMQRVMQLIDTANDIRYRDVWRDIKRQRLPGRVISAVDTALDRCRYAVSSLFARGSATLFGTDVWSVTPVGAKRMREREDEQEFDRTYDAKRRHLYDSVYVTWEYRDTLETSMNWHVGNILFHKKNVRMADSYMLQVQNVMGSLAGMHHGFRETENRLMHLYQCMRIRPESYPSPLLYYHSTTELIRDQEWIASRCIRNESSETEHEDSFQKQSLFLPMYSNQVRRTEMEPAVPLMECFCASVNKRIENRLHREFGSGVKLYRRSPWRWVKNLYPVLPEPAADQSVYFDEAMDA